MGRTVKNLILSPFSHFMLFLPISLTLISMPVDVELQVVLVLVQLCNLTKLPSRLSLLHVVEVEVIAAGAVVVAI